MTAAPFILATVSTTAAGTLSDWLAKRVGLRPGRRVVPALALAAAAILVLVGAHVEGAYLAVLTLSGSDTVEESRLVPSRPTRRRHERFC